MRLFTLLICLLLNCFLLTAMEENFVLMDGNANKIIFKLGPNCDKPLTPCSTFKIFLSLIGYDSGILCDANMPAWEFQEGYDDFREEWKNIQTPYSWMKTSCIWYSQKIASILGEEKIQKYLKSLKYGNQDISGGLTKFWVTSSLQISPIAQTEFIQRMVAGKLPINSEAYYKTKELLYMEEIVNDWKLYGKTGWSGSVKEHEERQIEIGWFVGWIEKEDQFFPFAYVIQDKKLDLSHRILRTKQLLHDLQLFKN